MLEEVYSFQMKMAINWGLVLKPELGKRQGPEWVKMWANNPCTCMNCYNRLMGIKKDV